MAKNISTTFSVDLSGVVSNAITTVKAIRKSETARKEAEFQRAIANGLSYDDQIAMRDKQLVAEKDSSMSDPDFVISLEKSITDTKKLNRFNKYRTSYASSLGELSSGKINEEQYLSILKNQLTGIDDPELRLEIQGDITTALTKVKTYKDTILSNQVKKAKYDGTKSTLNDAISRVNTARAEALINDNQDEVTAYDETLSALNSQVSAVTIQDSITDFQVKSSTRGTKPVEKLNFINQQFQNANSAVPIKIGDRSYTSAQQFWSQEQNNFLAGNSQIFGNFFDELNNDSENNISVTTAKFGYPTQGVLDETLSTFNELRTKPELAPFLSRLDITQATVMTKAVDILAKAINNIGTNNLTFQDADVQLQNISTKYGVDVTGYRLQLDEKLRNLESSDVITEDEAIKLAPDFNIALPKINKDVVKPASTTPTTQTTSNPTTGSRVVKSGDTLSGIAKESGINLAQLLELNPQFKQNPNIIRPGQSIVTKAQDVSVAPTIPTTPTITPVPTTTPVPTSPPMKETPPTAYTGSSVVDYLKSVGQDNSFVSRQKIAMEKGIQNYSGTSEQNNELLKTLRGS